MSISNDKGILKLLDLADDKFNENLDSQLKYWKQQLVGSPPLLELPTDRPRSPVMTYAGKTQYLELPQSLTEALKALSENSGVTLFMTLLAAFQTLLYRYSGQSDIIGGTPMISVRSLILRSGGELKP